MIPAGSAAPNAHPPPRELKEEVIVNAPPIPGRRPRRSVPAALATLAAVLATAILGATPAVAGPPRSPSPADGYHYVDCAAASDGDGSHTRPWNSLVSASSHELGPGEALLFKRGTTCRGALTPTGSGAEGSPIVIDAYGDPTAATPVIAGDGVPETVLLRNQQYWEIRNLEITNADPDPAAQYRSQRRGVVISNVDAGRLTHFRLENLFIHDVLGEGRKDLGGSGAIQLEVDTQDGQTRSWFDDTVITGNRIENVNRSGINMSTVWKCRAEMAWDSPCNPRDPDATPFVPSTGLIIRKNRLTNIGGDGIVVQMNDGAIVESNYLERGAARYNSHNAGIWVWNSDNTLFQYNVVTNMQKINQNDGTAWDADYGSRNTVFQYNLSYDNAGGGMFFCGCGNWKIEGLGFATDVVHRYNISIADGEAAELADISGNVNARRYQFLSGVTDSTSYNNTIILADPEQGRQQVNGTNDTGNGLLMGNNLLVTTGEVAPDTYDTTTNVLTWLNNAFSGPGINWPAGTNNVTLTDPLLEDVAGTDPISAFLARSPQLASAGVPIAPAGTYDIAGNEVPEGCAPDIGAFQFSDPGRRECARSWEDRTVRPGETLTIPVRANATLKVSGKVTGQEAMVVTTPSGLAQTATRDPRGGTVSTIVRTSTDPDPTLTITCGRSGCRQVTVTDAADDMVDGSFESLKNSPWYLSPWTSWVSPWSGTAAQRARQAAELRTSDASTGVVAAGTYGARITSAEPKLAQDNIPVQGGTGYRIAAWTRPAAGAEPLTFTLYPFVDNVIGTDPIATFSVPSGDDGPVRLDERFVMPEGVSAVTVLITQDGLPSGAEASLDNLTLTPDDSRPRVTRQPADVTVTAGNAAALLAEFAGNDAPRIEWQTLSRGGWTPVRATKLGQEGQTERTARLVLDDVQESDSGTKFRAVARNSSGTVTTKVVTLRVESRDYPRQ